MGALPKANHKITYVFQLSFKITTATVFCAILGCILTIGLAFSIRIRCIVLLTLPQFFSEKGRQALLAYAFILTISGPARNILNNMGILSDSLACGQEQLKSAVRQIIEVIKKPFYAIKDAIKKVVKTVKEIIKKIKEILLAIKRIIMAIVRVIKAAFEFIARIINICNKELGTPFERCSRVFENAILDCNAKLGPLFNWLCSLAHIVKAVCYLVKPFDLVCMIVDFISNSVIGVVIRKVKQFVRHIKTMFYVRIKFSHSFEFHTNSSKSVAQISEGIVTEIRQRTQVLQDLIKFLTSAASLFFMFIIFKVIYYRYKFLTSERFDNKYITKDFHELDMRRAKHGKETVLPLNNRESKTYVKVSSAKLIKTEKKALSKAISTLATATVKIAIYIAADYSLFWVLNLIKYYGRFQSKVQAPNLPMAYISGKGLLADLLRSIVKAFQPMGLQIEIDTVPCLPTPIPPDYDRYVQIAILLVLCWILTVLEPYGLRLRHTVMSYYHPTRARQRSIWLYNHIMRSRNSFLKFARRQLRRKIFGGKGIEKVTCKEYLAANFRVLAICLDKPQLACLLCGTVFREGDDKKPIRCHTPGCTGVYCDECFADLQNLCTICLSPIDYGDLSDIDEEKDSSADEPASHTVKEKVSSKSKRWKCLRRKRKKLLEQDIVQLSSESEGEAEGGKSLKGSERWWSDTSVLHIADKNEPSRSRERKSFEKERTEIVQQDIAQLGSESEGADEEKPGDSSLTIRGTSSGTKASDGWWYWGSKTEVSSQAGEEGLMEKTRKIKRKGSEIKRKESKRRWFWGPKSSTTAAGDSSDEEQEELQLLEERKSEEVDEGLVKKLPDSDYYSSDNSTDYSYSYQDKPKDDEPAPLRTASFRDVEKQDIRDYASLQSFREEGPEPKQMRSVQTDTSGTAVDKLETVITKTAFEPMPVDKRVEFIGVPEVVKKKRKLEKRKRKKRTKPEEFPLIDSDLYFGSDSDLTDLEHNAVVTQSETSSTTPLKSTVSTMKTYTDAEGLADITADNGKVCPNIVPSLELHSSRKSLSDKFSHVEVEEISESLPSTFSTRNLSSSSNISVTPRNRPRIKKSRKSMHLPTIARRNGGSTTSLDEAQIESKHRKRVKDYYKAVNTDFPGRIEVKPRQSSIVQKILPRKKNLGELPLYNPDEFELRECPQKRLNPPKCKCQPKRSSESSIGDPSEKRKKKRVRGGGLEPQTISFQSLLTRKIQESEIHIWPQLQPLERKEILTRYYLDVEDLTPTRDFDSQMSQEAIELAFYDTKNSKFQKNQDSQPTENNLPVKSSSSNLSFDYCTNILGRPCTSAKQSKKSDQALGIFQETLGNLFSNTEESKLVTRINSSDKDREITTTTFGSPKVSTERHIVSEVKQVEEIIETADQKNSQNQKPETSSQNSNSLSNHGAPQSFLTQTDQKQDRNSQQSNSLNNHSAQQSLIAQPDLKAIRNSQGFNSLSDHAAQQLLIAQPDQKEKRDSQGSNSLNNHSDQQPLVSQPDQEEKRNSQGSNSLSDHAAQQLLIAQPDQKEKRDSQGSNSLNNHSDQQPLVSKPDQEEKRNSQGSNSLGDHSAQQSLVTHPEEKQAIHSQGSNSLSYHNTQQNSSPFNLIDTADKKSLNIKIQLEGYQSTPINNNSQSDKVGNNKSTAGKTDQKQRRSSDEFKPTFTSSDYSRNQRALGPSILANLSPTQRALITVIDPVQSVDRHNQTSNRQSITATPTSSNMDQTDRIIREKPQRDSSSYQLEIEQQKYVGTSDKMLQTSENNLLQTSCYNCGCISDKLKHEESEEDALRRSSAQMSAHIQAAYSVDRSHFDRDNKQSAPVCHYCCKCGMCYDDCAYYKKVRRYPSEKSVRGVNRDSPRQHRERMKKESYSPYEIRCEEYKRHVGGRLLRRSNAYGDNSPMRYSGQREEMICMCTGDCGCSKRHQTLPPIPPPFNYRPCQYDSNSEEETEEDIYYSDSAGYDLPYQNNAEYLDLVQELEETLHNRSKARVKRAMREFEQRSRYNKPLERPIINYDETSESEEPLIQKINELTEKKKCSILIDNSNCRCRAPKESPHHHCVQTSKPRQRSTSARRRIRCPGKTHWQMDSKSGEWYKVGDAYTMRTPSPQEGYCPCDCTCCATKEYR